MHTKSKSFGIDNALIECVFCHIRGIAVNFITQRHAYSVSSRLKGKFQLHKAVVQKKKITCLKLITNHSLISKNIKTLTHSNIITFFCLNFLHSIIA